MLINVIVDGMILYTRRSSSMVQDIMSDFKLYDKESEAAFSAKRGKKDKKTV